MTKLTIVALLVLMALAPMAQATNENLPPIGIAFSSIKDIKHQKEALEVYNQVNGTNFKSYRSLELYLELMRSNPIKITP
jgi:hypothetical protein